MSKVVILFEFTGKTHKEMMLSAMNCGHKKNCTMKTGRPMSLLKRMVSFV